MNYTKNANACNHPLDDHPIKLSTTKRVYSMVPCVSGIAYTRLGMRIFSPFGEYDECEVSWTILFSQVHAKKRDLSCCSATICRFLRSRFTRAHARTHTRTHTLTYICRHTQCMHHTKRGRDRRLPLRIANERGNTTNILL